MLRRVFRYLKMPCAEKLFGVLMLLALSVVAAPAWSQGQSQSQAPNPNPPRPSQTQPAQEIPLPPPAKPADVASVDSIMAATYDVISGPASQKRDWDRFRSLFLPGARLIAAVPNKTGGFGARSFTPDEYATRAAPYFEKNGFTEGEISRHADRYGNIVQIFSTYESRHDAKDPKPFARGINSFQLFFDGARWWVVTIYWQEETPDNPVPKEFLSATR